MEASLCCFPTSKNPLSPSRYLALTRLPSAPYRPRRSAPSFTVRATISRAKKEEIVAKVKQELVGCHLIAGIRYKGLTCKQLESIRNALPPSSRLLVAKNTLVGKAAEGTPWSVITPCLHGMTAWLFVHSEEIPEALKPFRDFQCEYKLEEINDYTGAVFEGRFYAPNEFEFLENMPSRDELYSKILGAVQGPAISLVGTLQAPARDVLLTLKAYVRKLEEESGGAAAA